MTAAPPGVASRCQDEGAQSAAPRGFPQRVPDAEEPAVVTARRRPGIGQYPEPVPRLDETFQRLRSKGEKALVLYVTAGDPSLDDLPAIIEALVEGGADVIEVGVPFSDPIADGPTIQASSQRALDRGVRPGQILAKLKEVQATVPVVLMGYYNTMLRPGLGVFADQATASGVSGVIVCDIIPEEAEDWIKVSRERGLDTVFLASPTSTPERLGAVARESSGFIYAVSRTGVTGASQKAGDEAARLVESLKGLTDKPVCVGFGISKPEHVAAVCRVADGAVIGSWLVDLLAVKWQGGRGREEVVAAVRDLKDATKDT